MRALLLLTFVIASLASCEQLQPAETAQHALRVFCALHKADILATLLTDQQRQAGTIVCSAVGMGLGT